MARPGMNGDQARKMVRIAQFAGLGLGVAAAALWALDVPGLTGALPAKPVVSGGQGLVEPPKPVLIVSIANDAPLGIGERLEVAANRPAVTTEPAPSTKPSSTTVESGHSTPWKYLGPIAEATRTLALVSIEGKQRIVSEGSVVKITTPPAEGRPESVDYRASVEKIALDHMDIKEDDGRIVRLSLEPRTTKVSWLKNMPTNVAGAGGAPGTLTAEARARLAQQGIDPQQIEATRRALAAQQAGNGRNRATAGGPENGMPVAGQPAPGRVIDVVRSSGTPNTPQDADAAASVKPMSQDVDSATNTKTRSRVRNGAAN